MLKSDIHQSANSNLSAHLKSVLLSCFTEEEVKELERCGGRVQVSVTILKPFNAPNPKEAILSDDDIVRQIAIRKGSTEQLRALFNELPVKKLQAVAKSLRIPLRSGATANEIRSSLISFIQAEDNWQSISGSKK